MMRRSVRAGVRAGLSCGRELRSTIPCLSQRPVIGRLSGPPSSPRPGTVPPPAAAPVLINDTTGQPQTTGFRQWSITVDHEDLR